jgi:tetratricopeptide (TPR) repeat protein
MANRLSVCLVTRNEETKVGRAIRSVQGIADDVIVAETGSTDRTADIAQGLGARVIPFAWDDDFSAARNFAIAQAKGDWILWLNPDEELVPEAHEPLRTIIGSPGDAFGYLARVQSLPRGDRPDQFVETWDLRLYRRRPDLRYVGRLHPSFAPELAKTVAEEGLHVSPSALLIRQHAYTSTLDASKLRWAVRLLERELRDRPGQLHYLIEYAHSLLLLNDPRGHEVMAQAIEQALPAFEAQTSPGPDTQVLLEYALTTPAALNQSRLGFDQAMSLSLRFFPSSPPLLWALAEVYFKARQFPAAIALLERLVQLGNTGTYDHSRGFDPRIVGAWALSNLGQCYRAIGRRDDARRCFQALLRDEEFRGNASQALAELDALTSGATNTTPPS